MLVDKKEEDNSGVVTNLPIASLPAAMPLRPDRIRIANPSDRPRVIDIINRVAGERRYLQTDRYRPTPVWEHVLNYGLNRRRGLLLLVVEVERDVIGFGRLTADSGASERIGNIGLALLPEFRSKRIGTTLLAQLIDCAPILGFTTLTANVLATNERSRRLFRRFGFSPTSQREIYVPFWSHPVDEFVMELSLSRRGFNGLSDYKPSY